MKPNRLISSLATTALFIGSISPLEQPTTAGYVVGEGSGIRSVEEARTRTERSSVRFFCSFSNGITTLHVKTVRGSFLILSGNKYFSASGYTAQQRCEQIASTFEISYSKGLLAYLTVMPITGRYNAPPPRSICASRTDYGCNVILFTLEPGEDPGQVLGQIAKNTRASVDNNPQVSSRAGSVYIGGILVAASVGGGTPLSSTRGSYSSGKPDARTTIPQKSIEELEKQVLRYRKVGDRKNEAATLIKLGAKYISLNQFTKALETYNQALTLYRQVGDRIGEADMLRRLANLYADSNINLASNYPFLVGPSTNLILVGPPTNLSLEGSAIQGGNTSLIARSGTVTITSQHSRLFFTNHVISTHGDINFSSRSTGEFFQSPRFVAYRVGDGNLLNFPNQPTNFFNATFTSRNFETITFVLDGNIQLPDINTQAGNIPDSGNIMSTADNISSAIAEHSPTFNISSDDTLMLARGTSIQAFGINAQDINIFSSGLITLATGSINSASSIFNISSDGGASQGILIKGKVESTGGIIERSLLHSQSQPTNSLNATSSNRSVEANTLAPGGQIKLPGDNIQGYNPPGSGTVTIPNESTNSETTARSLPLSISGDHTIVLDPNSLIKGSDINIQDINILVSPPTGIMPDQQLTIPENGNPSSSRDNKEDSPIKIYGRVTGGIYERSSRPAPNQTMFLTAGSIDTTSSRNSNTSNLSLRQQALSIYKALGDRRKQAETLNEIGSTYQGFGQYPEALRSYQEALKLPLAINHQDDHVDKAAILNNIGEVFRKQGQYSKALNFYDQALAAFSKVPNRHENFVITGRGGIPGGETLTRGLAPLAKDLEETKPVEVVSFEGAVLNNIGLVHNELGQYPVAISLYERSLNLRRNANDRRGEGTTLHNLGFAYDQLKQNDKAIQFYQSALAARREAGDLRGEAITLNNLGLVYNDQKQYPKALEQLQSALRTFEALGDHSNTGNTLDSIATVYKSLKQYATAQVYYQRAIAILREVGDRNTLGISLTNLGDLYEQKGDKPKAIAAYQQAIDESLETILADLKGEELQAAFSAKHADTYARLINLLWDAGRFEDAFNYVERAKARAFLNQMAGEHINLRAGADATLLKQEQAQRAELADLNNQLKSFSNRVLGEDDKQAIAKLKAKLDALQQSYAQLLEQLQRQNPEAADLVSVNPAKLADIQQLLDQNTTLVEYFVTDDRTLAFLITRNSFKAVPLGVGRAALTEAVRSLYEYDFATLQNRHPASLKQLHQWLIQPLKSQISTGKLKIVPHNILHYVPFAALTDGQNFLIDDYTLSTLPSASVMRFLAKKHKPDNGKLLVFGNPTLDLSYASQEANTVAEMYKTQAIVGAKATKDALQAQAKQDSILHLATHGEFNAINPLFSALFLAPNKGKDDRLEVHEIYELDLTKATNLVVLSACQSQVGELSRGDELVGLNRAFLYAGTPSVIASLWNIDDQATGLLMQKFYGYLRQGNGKAAALQKAQREVRAEYAHPYYWAAFVLTGDGD